GGGGRRVVVATATGGRGVVAGLPLAVRAVLPPRELGVSDVTVVAGAKEPAVTAALGRRGLTVGADGLSISALSAAPTLVVAGDGLFDGTGLAPLLTWGAAGRTPVPPRRRAPTRPGRPAPRPSA